MALNITQLELLTIRYMAWLIEALTWPHSTNDDLHPTKRNDIIHRLSDDIEHIAQYHLENLPEKDRARNLVRDIERLRHVTTATQVYLTNIPLNKPSIEDIDFLDVNLKQINVQIASDSTNESEGIRVGF